MTATLDAKDLRRALGHFVTGVTVVTTRCLQGSLQGITANSFSSVSLDPPLVLVSVARTLSSFQHFRSCNAFAVHLLGDDQRDISNRFAARGSDKWAGIDVGEGVDGIPLLPNRLGLFECKLHATHDGGDHEILIGRVVRYDVAPETPPLVFFKGAYRSISL